MLAKITTGDKLPKMHKNDFDTANKLYGILYYDSIGKHHHIANFAKTRSMYNTVLKDFTTIQLFCMIFCHFEWYGQSGRQEHEYQYVASKGFPLELLVHNRFQYSAYCLEVLGGAIWTDDSKLNEVLDIWILRLMSKKES